MVQRENKLPSIIWEVLAETGLKTSLEPRFSSHEAAFFLYFLPKAVKSLDTQKQNQKYFLLKLSNLVCVMKSIWLSMMWNEADYLKGDKWKQFCL